MGEMIEFEANGHTTCGYLSVPKSGTGPGLIVIQEWWGLVDHIKDVVDRFAQAGFVALAPDMFHGESTTHPDDAGRMMMALDIEHAAEDLVSAADYLCSLEVTKGDEIGVLGFCMGGQLAVYTATKHDRIGAAVNFYGIHPNVTPDFGTLNCPVLCHFGKTDGFVNEEAANGLVSAIQDAGKSVDAHFYETGHAFFNDSRPEAYDDASAKLAWERSVAFLSARLGA